MDIKEKILEKSAELFLSIGVKAVTMDDVSNSLGMSKKTLYSHFSTKKILIKETLTFFLNHIDILINKVSSEDLNAIEKWMKILDEITSNGRIDEKGSCSIQIRKYYPAIFEEVQQKQWESMERNIQSNLLQGISEKLFRDNFDLNLFLRFYYWGIVNIGENMLLEETKLTIKELKVKFVEFQIRSIATPRGVEELKRLINNK